MGFRPLSSAHQLAGTTQTTAVRPES
jgi:hypothetical protein